ncbi:glycoside hydrolase family 25 protein [Erythrobacter sp. SN021]|uniref:glycoside hydrolase family 25 protein n=1 Tax=Erythrobacter sp. SN021 TaxID=2912574 RepID=UPI001F46C27B|nr:glycoside hydrolase family 25 protein [Erythrobacter sp. SN021]MCF8883772.1 glycoside hydrolase family 25 protein [Erythrobacter sp. SN021]
MARNNRRRRKSRLPKALSRAGKTVLVLLVVAAIGASYAWYEGRSWRPDEALWPDQGGLIGAGDGAVDFDTIAGLGAKFVYLEASDGAGRKDIAFAQNFARARAAGLEVGAAHRFDPCAVADGQSANYVTMVPRDSDLLPPAILLETTAAICPSRVSKAAVQSELTTLVNQIEAHSGKPVILAPFEEFEEAYAPSRRFDRQLWLTRSWFEPDYATRPWLMWTANRWYQTEAAQSPLRWVVVQP